MTEVHIPIGETPDRPFPDDEVSPVEESTPTEDEALVPDLNPSDPFKLSDGSEVRVRELKLKEFLVMMRIITRGAAMAFNGGYNIDPNSPTFVQDLAYTFIFAVAEAEHEAIEFIQVMVDPVDTSEQARANLAVLLSNPDLEDVLEIITRVIGKAAPNIKALGKRLASLMKMAQKVGQL